MFGLLVAQKKCLISCDFHRWQVGPVVQRSGVSQDFISPRCNNLEINKASLIKKKNRGTVDYDVLLNALVDV